jgi:hypothetical protein
MSTTNGTVVNEALSLHAGSTTMTVLPRLGARIIGFELDGQNVLLDSDAVFGTENQNNFGATFWPSPQAAWGWPPIAALDREPFRSRSIDGRLVLESASGSLLDGTRISLTKTITPVAGASAFEVTYVVTNHGERAAALAGWQIARVRAGGLSFFRLGPGGVASDKLSSVTVAGVQWYAYDPAVVVSQGQKTFADASGWLAHLDGDLLFVQSFPDVAPGAAAAGEAEVELYADPSHTYVELEPQARVMTLLPGQRSEDWTVRWSLQRLPAGISRQVGSRELIALAESLVAP